MGLRGRQELHPPQGKASSSVHSGPQGQLSLDCLFISREELVLERSQPTCTQRPGDTALAFLPERQLTQ